MDNLTTLLFIIISCIIGICISLFCELKSYLLIAFICTIIFICIELYYKYKLNNSTNTNTNTNINKNKPYIDVNLTNELLQKYQQNPQNYVNQQYQQYKQLLNKSQNNTQNTQNNKQTTQLSHFSQLDANSVIPTNSQHATQYLQKVNTPLPNTQAITTTAITQVKTHSNIINSNNSPLDGLEPTELLSRLNYLYQATLNPAHVINYNTYKTHADKYLMGDNTSILSHDEILHKTTNNHYPQLTYNQIDATDCLNEGSNKNSCFQNPQLFYNVKNNFNILNNNILNKGVNLDNANLIVREDFSMPMVLNANNRYMPIMFKNAPNGNLDKPLDSQSNEYIDLTLDANTQCIHCKLASCSDNRCKLQNNLFI